MVRLITCQRRFYVGGGSLRGFNYERRLVVVHDVDKNDLGRDLPRWEGRATQGAI